MFEVGGETVSSALDAMTLDIFRPRVEKLLAQCRFLCTFSLRAISRWLACASGKALWDTNNRDFLQLVELLTIISNYAIDKNHALLEFMNARYLTECFYGNSRVPSYHRLKTRMLSNSWCLYLFAKNIFLNIGHTAKVSIAILAASIIGKHQSTHCALCERLVKFSEPRVLITNCSSKRRLQQLRHGRKRLICTCFARL